EILVLGVAALDRERHQRLAVLQRKAGRQRGARALSRLNHIEWIDGLVEDETLHALAEADAGTFGNESRDPATAWGDRDDPAFRIGGLNRGGAGKKGLVRRHQARLLEAFGAFGDCLGRIRLPL